MREYSFSVTEHDPDRPWVVRGHRRGVVELADDQDFFTWAHAAWPSDRCTVELDPWQLVPK